MKNPSIEIKEVEEDIHILELWNQEMGLIYPITPFAYEENVAKDSSKHIFCAYDEKRIVGFLILKSFHHEMLLDYVSLAFVSLFYVSKKYRHQGIGTKLFDIAESYCDGKTIQIGKDIHNFFPGVPTDFDNLTDVWLEKRGYQGIRYTHDLISRNPKPLKIENTLYKFTSATLHDQEELISFLLDQRWARWAYEAKEYFLSGGTGEEYLLIKDKGKIIAFCRINDKQTKQMAYNMMWQERFNSLGGIGPLGVDCLYRKKHLGLDIVSYAIDVLKERSVTEIMIDWTGLMEFYQQFCFEVWKSYKYMCKKL